MPAVTDAYATDTEYRAATGKAGSGTDATLNNDLLAVSRYIDGELNRFFTKDATDATRVYMPWSTGKRSREDWAESENPWRYGGMSRYLSIDDLSAAPTTIKIDLDGDGIFTDETALAATDYELLPRNALVGPEPTPYIAIEIPRWSTLWGWPPGLRVQVVGKFGWPTVPAAIKSACIQLTAILRLESPRARREMAAPGLVLGMSAPAQNIIADLMGSYSRGVGL